MTAIGKVEFRTVTAPVGLASELVAIVRPGVLWWDGARVTDRVEALDAEIAAVAARTVAAPPPETQAVREMYRRVGLDPTKTRPSNEALLRRVRRGQPFPRINPLVDAVNLCSLEWQLPYGVYDRRALAGPISLRRGAAGEAYDGIRKDTVHVAGRLTAADALGPFGNPTSDSARAMVTTATVDALIVIYAPASVVGDDVRRVLDRTAARVGATVGGRESGRWVA
jgi:DNA/RNA-binding domain of Phe-tRNA-synthetase-like protein